MKIHPYNRHRMRHAKAPSPSKVEAAIRLYAPTNDHANNMALGTNGRKFLPLDIRPTVDPDDPAAQAAPERAIESEQPGQTGRQA